MAPMGSTIGRLGVVCACLASGDAFFTGVTLPSAGLTAQRTSVARGGCGGLFMAKHRQNKGTKKHVKNRPRKSRLSDINRTPVEHPIESSNAEYPGKPAVYAILEEAPPGIDTKASVIEAKAAAEWDQYVADAIASGERPAVLPPMRVPDKAGIAAQMKEFMYEDDRRHQKKEQVA